MATDPSVTLESKTLEKVRATITTRADPTGALPAFQLTPGASFEPDGTWEDGEWEDSYTNGVIHALTPTIGDAGTLVIAQGESYMLWARWTVGAELPVKDAGSVYAT